MANKLVAILGGGDWADASAEHIVCPEDMDLAAEKESYDAWYKHEYCPQLRSGNPLKYESFKDRLVRLGARDATDADIEIFHEMD